MANAMLFPSTGLQVLCALIHFIGLSVIAHCISRRVQHERLTYHGLKTMPWPRLSMILMFCDSWLFLFSSGILVLGVGLELNKSVCTAAIYLCVIFYATSKFLVYAFLTEKVHVVWSPTVGTRRFESPVYLTCLVTVALYCIVITLMMGGPIHEINADGACVIGMRRLASIPLLVYDLYVNVFLTFMFLWPLVRSKLLSSGVRRLAVRTFVAALVALTTSTVNMAVLIVLKGRELGWVFIGACGADVIVNAVAIFWVSGGGHHKHHPDITSSGLPERGRRNTFRPNRTVDSQQVTDPEMNSKTSFASPNDEENFPYSATASFPIYRDLDSIHEGNSRSWFSRLFRTEKSPPLDLRIAVTTEYELQQPLPQAIHLHPRPESKSESECDPAPNFPSPPPQ
ncbi:hypothetical protein BDQ12DRAFT_686276 [Crucibulum laeve]|uniref:Transmembrane protein n=1 Tax=Crucibulum laeve TaxID=68775 RepID=A0A5C3LVR9_9AGAR|nr:hypothetical protein BDQ12DRAFT_686276 [Crucibulum laeve]